MSEVKNEGLEVVAYECLIGRHIGLSYERHGADPVALCRHSEALAGYAVRDTQIAGLEKELSACATAVDNCEVFRVRIAELEDDLKCAHSMLGEVSKKGMDLRAELAVLAKKYTWALAELAAMKAQGPVSKVSEETFSSDGTSDIITHNLPIGTKLYAAPVAKQVVMPEPSFYWADSEEGSFGSPEEWAQDYYDYNGEKPESVLLSCAASLPDREYDSFEFDGSGNCISCRLVGEDSARLNAADQGGGQDE